MINDITSSAQPIEVDRQQPRLTLKGILLVLLISLLYITIYVVILVN